MTTPIVSAFGQHYASLEGALPGADLPWMRRLREAGLSRFRADGLPTPKWENWKYTNLRDLEKVAYRPSRTEGGTARFDRVPALLANPDIPRMVFVDGNFRAELSDIADLPEGVTLLPLSDAVANRADLLEKRLAADDDGGRPLKALNTALMADGLVLQLPRGTVMDRPIEAVFVGGLSDAPVAYHPRLVLSLEDNADAALLETHVGLGDGCYLSNGVTQIRLGQGARLRHVKFQNESREAFHLAGLHIEQRRDSRYEGFGLSLGGRLSRNEAAVKILGSGAECRLGGSYLMRDNQHCDNTTVIEHKAPRTGCREVFKGVLDDKARAVFQGKIVVHRDAQQTDGHQLSKALLLSNRAEIDAKPELEIYADDVKCSHGATTGDLDGSALFYLRTRGIPEKVARGLLVESFLAEALEEVGDEAVRNVLSGHVKEWLEETTRESGD